SVEQPAAFEESCRIGQPHRIPVGFDLARGRPARACSAVVAFKTWRVQQQGLHHVRHVAISSARSRKTDLAPTKCNHEHMTALAKAEGRTRKISKCFHVNSCASSPVMRRSSSCARF